MASFFESVVASLETGDFFVKLFRTGVRAIGWVVLALALIIVAISLFTPNQGQAAGPVVVAGLWIAAVGFAIFELSRVRGRHFDQVNAGTMVLPILIAKFLRFQGELTALVVVAIGLPIALSSFSPTLGGASGPMVLFGPLAPLFFGFTSMGEAPFWLQFVVLTFAIAFTALYAAFALSVNYLVAALVEVLFDIARSNRGIEQACIEEQSMANITAS